MASNGTIKTYGIDEIRDSFIHRDSSLSTFFKSEFNRFFVIREQDLVNFVNLPIPPIRSTANLIIFITKGQALMNVGITEYIVGSNECLVIPAGQVFSMDKPDSWDIEGYLCSFDNDVAVGKVVSADLLKQFDFLKLWGRHLISLNAENSVYVQQIFERLLADFAANSISNLPIIQSYLLALLCELNSAYEVNHDSINDRYHSIANNFKALLFDISKPYAQVNDYAKKLNITPNHLNKVLKHTTGKSTSNWVEEMVVMEAKLLLSHTNLTINEVSASLGFDDPGYFARLFKKRENRSPTEYRKMIEKS